jgi:hypothetical protein
MGVVGATARHLDLTSAALLDHRDRHLPVSDAWAGILPDGGLVRGRTVAFAGGAAVSLALTLVASATRSGSWLGLVGVPWIGAEAASELGVALERTVSVAVEPDAPVVWAERTAAAVDGFELVVTSVPARVPDRLLRQVRQRLQARGGVLIDIVPDRRDATADLVISSRTEQWEGLGWGTGHLRRRRVELTVAGRRMPRPRQVVCWLPDVVTEQA